ncbi:MAG: serine/threonine-protein phosphatase [Chloroflexi bacterium]|nr:serine/threonine-protein phosphatase [Chloroflexota bacterium]
MGERKIEVGAVSDVGRRRDHNEDAWIAFLTDAGQAVCVVADGMGGHLAGEVASARTVEVLDRELHQTTGDLGGSLRTSIERANRAIWEEAQQDEAKRGMGSTVVAAILSAGRAYLANVGDSPAFLVRSGEARQVTRDHGWVAEQIEAGVISPEDGERHPFRHVLTRCLGVEADVQVEVYPPLDLAAGDVLVLCSDGLTEHVRPVEVAHLAGEAGPEQAAQVLVDLAIQRGGHDNVTVVVARVG